MEIKFPILRCRKISLIATSLLLGVVSSSLNAVSFSTSGDVSSIINGDAVSLYGNQKTYTITNNTIINTSNTDDLVIVNAESTIRNSTIINNGNIISASTAIEDTNGINNSITNNRTITSTNGFALIFDSVSSIVNSNTGIINGGVQGWSGTITNNGLINLTNIGSIITIPVFMNGIVRINL